MFVKLSVITLLLDSQLWRGISYRVYLLFSFVLKVIKWSSRSEIVELDQNDVCQVHFNHFNERINGNNPDLYNTVSNNILLRATTIERPFRN